MNRCPYCRMAEQLLARRDAGELATLLAGCR